MTSTPHNENAAAEMIGALMLISIFVVVVALVAVVLFSQPAPQKVPALNMKFISEGDHTIKIFHNGGDAIPTGHYKVFIDNNDATPYIQNPPPGKWELGDTLEYRVPWTITPDTYVLVIYSNGGTSGSVLASNGTSISPGAFVPPGAVFTSNITTGLVPLAVQFTDSSINTPAVWAWTFGDGGTSSLQNPVHTYTSAGIFTVTLTVQNSAGSSSTSRTITANPIPAKPIAAFTSNVTTGPVSLTVNFTDLSANNPTSWNWSFGDGNFSTQKNPVHTFDIVGLYTVSLNVTNAQGSDTLSKTINATQKPFVNYIVDDRVFVYGTSMDFAGDNVDGPYATIVIKGPLNDADVNGGGHIAVSTIYVDGDITLTSGSASLGSPTNPGTIYVNGNLNLWGGTRDIWGDVYVVKNFNLKNCRIHGDVYVNGDLTLDWGVPSIDDNKFIYYTGTLTAPAYYDTTFLSKCIKVTTVPAVIMPSQPIASPKSAAWYTSKGYSTASTGPLTSGSRIYAPTGYSYSYYSGGNNPATSVVIVASTGDISLTNYGSGGVTGVLFAPNGKVTFNGGSFEGVVIARDGFDVTSGGTAVTFKNIDEYINDPGDYPF